MEREYSEDGEISLKEIILKSRDWVKFVLSRWLIIFILASFGGITGLLYSYSIKPTYTAQLTFVLEEEQSGGGGLGGYAGIAGQFGIDLGGGGGGAFTGDNLLMLMKSRSMIEKALLTSVVTNSQKETLAEMYIRINNLRELWSNADSPNANVRFFPGANAAEFSLVQNSLITSFYNSILSKNLTIDKLDKKSSIIEVKVTSPSELFAKYFSEAITKEVADFYIEAKTKKSVQNLAILQHQTDSVKRVFNSAISGVAVSTDANPNPNPALQILRVPSQRRQFDVQVNQAILSQLVQNLEMAKVSLRKETPLIQIIDSPILPLKVERADTTKMIIVGVLIMVFLTVFSLVIFKAVGSYLKS